MVIGGVKNLTVTAVRVTVGVGTVEDPVRTLVTLWDAETGERLVDWGTMPGDRHVWPGMAGLARRVTPS